MASIDVQHTIAIRSGVRLELATVQMDSSYPTGGEPLAPATGGGWWKAFVESAAGYVPTWDKVNQKLLVYRQSAATGALTEVPNGTDLSAVAFEFLGFRV